MIERNKEGPWKREFQGRKVLVSWYESPSFKAGNSKGLKSTEKGSSWLPEMLINNVYFCRKERPSTQCCEVRKCRICSKQRTEFLPSCLWLNVGEIASCKLRTAINPSRPPRRGGGPGGLNGVGMRIGMWVGMLHDDWFLVKHVWWCKGTKNSWKCQRKPQIFWYNME